MDEVTQGLVELYQAEKKYIQVFNTSTLNMLESNRRAASRSMYSVCTVAKTCATCTH